eukprot:gene28968-34959_t
MEGTISRQKSEASGEIREKLVASKVDLFFLGITIVIGGQYFSWNEGLQYEFTPYLVSVLLMTIGYLVLIFSLAEMTSTLPFSGGSYGFVRVAMGPFFGFVVGYCEAVLNIMYVASSVIPFGEMLTIVTGLPSAYEPLYWFFFFATSLYIHAARGRLFWTVNAVIAIVSILILVLYVLSTLQYVNINKYAMSSEKDTSTGNQVVAAFAGLPLSSWFYVGVEMLPLAAFESNRPRRDVPIAMTYPGIEVLSDSLLPLNYGFSRAFGISYSSATWLTLPAVYGTAFGFMYDYSRQLTAMSKSGLMPIKVPFQDRFPDAVFTLHREFRSPFGISGAVVGIIIFCVSIVSAVALQKDTIASVFLAVVLVVVSIYYFVYARHHQKFSDDEQKALFSAYIINANIRTKKTNKNRKSRVSDLSARARNLLTSSRNSLSSQSSQAGTVRRTSASSFVERKNTGVDTITSVVSTLESLKLNSESQLVPSVLETFSPNREMPDDAANKKNSFELAASLDYSEVTHQGLPNVTSDRAMRDTADELESKSPIMLDGKMLHPFSLRASAIANGGSGDQEESKDSPNSHKPSRGSKLRRSLTKVVDTINVISNMAKVLPIIDDEEFNQIADETFVAGILSKRGSETDGVEVLVRSSSNNSQSKSGRGYNNNNSSGDK